MIDDQDRILLVQEASSGEWTMPGGWADLNFSPAENAVKETREESGIQVEVVKLIACWDKDKQNHPRQPEHVYKLVFLCRTTGGKLATSHETSGADFFHPRGRRYTRGSHRGGLSSPLRSLADRPGDAGRARFPPGRGAYRWFACRRGVGAICTGAFEQQRIPIQPLTRTEPQPNPMRTQAKLLLAGIFACLSGCFSEKILNFDFA